MNKIMTESPSNADTTGCINLLHCQWKDLVGNRCVLQLLTLPRVDAYVPRLIQGLVGKTTLASTRPAAAPALFR